MDSGPFEPSPSSSNNKEGTNAVAEDPTPSNTNVDTNIGSSGMPNATEDDGTDVNIRKEKKISLRCLGALYS